MDIEDKKDFTCGGCVLSMTQSTPSDVLLCLFLVATLLGTNACQRNEIASDVGPDSKAGATEKIGNAAGHDGPNSKIQLDLEQSKKNAVLRFPDLGVAGSEMNTAFLARVNHLKAMNSNELNNSNWPYLVAINVHAELDKLKRLVEEDKKRKDRIEKLSPPTLTSAEVLELKTLPFAEIQLIGIVTKVERSLSNKISGNMIVDDKIKCEFEYSAVNNSGNLVEIVKRGDGLFVNAKNAISGLIDAEFPLYHVGQRVTITGRFVKKGGSVAVFRFQPPFVGGIDTGAKGTSRSSPPR